MCHNKHDILKTIKNAIEYGFLPHKKKQEKYPANQKQIFILSKIWLRAVLITIDPTKELLDNLILNLVVFKLSCFVGHTVGETGILKFIFTS